MAFQFFVEKINSVILTTLFSYLQKWQKIVAAMICCKRFQCCKFVSFSTTFQHERQKTNERPKQNKKTKRQFREKTFRCKNGKFEIGARSLRPVHKTSVFVFLVLNLFFVENQTIENVMIRLFLNSLIIQSNNSLFCFSQKINTLT